MTIRVKLFGPQSQLAGRSELAIQFEGESATPQEVRQAVGKAEPRLSATLSNSRLAVNFEFADDARRIGPGDEVALIGMVCGG